MSAKSSVATAEDVWKYWVISSTSDLPNPEKRHKMKTNSYNWDALKGKFSAETETK